MALIANTFFQGPGIVSASVNTSGATLLVAVATNVTAMQDSKGNSWTQLPAQTGTFSSSTSLWYVLNPIVGSGHTFQDSSGLNQSAACIQAHDTFNALDTQTGASTVSTPGQGGSLTPSTAANLMISGIGGDTGMVGDPAITIDSGYTITDTNVLIPGTGFGTSLAYLTQASATAQNPAWTWTEQFASGIVNAVFKAGSGTAFTLTAAAGSYSVTGSSVNLKSARTMTVATGSYAVTGSAVTLTKSSGPVNYTLTADAGSYVITGVRVRLVWSGAPVGVFPQAMAIAVMGL